MKKFTKVSLIIAAIAGGIGTICIIVALCMGLNWSTFTAMTQNGDFSFGRIGNITFGSIDDVVERITERVTGNSDSSGAIASSNNIVAYSSSDVRALDIELGAGQLHLVYEDVDDIEINHESISGFESKLDDGTLKIESTFAGNGTVTVTVPKDKRFDDVDLEIGAGKVTIDMLEFVQLNAEVGAGQLTMTLPGEAEDYNYDMECAVGKIEIDGQTYSGLANDQTIHNTGATKTLDLEVVAGEIIVSFE